MGLPTNEWRRTRRLARTLLLLAAIPFGCGGGSSGTPSGPVNPGPDPGLLSSTGLYSDPATKTLDPANRPFAPQYALWADGGVKRRFIRLPAGTRIETGDMDHWVFPVGTKIWKEFSYGGRRVETRLIEKIAAGASLDAWRFQSFAWRADESDASLVAAEGAPDVAPTAFGTSHDIPSVRGCQDCHDRGGDAVLGFDALQLSDDRDPLAEEELPAGAVTLNVLATEGRLTVAPATAPRIHARTAAGRWAMGYLHANCGNCHNPQGTSATLGLFLRHSESAQSESGEPAYATTVNRLTRVYTVPGTSLGRDSYRVHGGAPELSAVLVRMRTRGGDAMPPMATEVVDETALGLLRDWVRSLPPP